MRTTVPFVNYPLQYRLIKDEIDAAIQNCLEHGDLIHRKQQEQFEKNFAAYCGSKHGIGTDSCTGAMHLSLYAHGIGPGDEVITTAHTYVATADVIVHCGATPILVDVNEHDHNMNMDQVEAIISPRTKAVIPVHLNGRICDMDKLTDIAKENELIVIEDAAQATGARYDNKKAGSFGATGCFSFYPAKILGSYGDGGAAITANKNLAMKLYVLRDHGELPSYLDRERKHKIHLWGFNSLLDNIQAAILDVKLKHLPEWIERRREIAKIYQEELEELDKITLMPGPDEDKKHYDVYQNYVIQTNKRDRLREYLKKNGVETLISWKTPMHKHPALGLSGYKHKLPATEKISRTALSLPMYPELTDRQTVYTARKVKKWATETTTA